MRLLATAVVGIASLALPVVANACPSTASYRSVVLNQVPPDIPADARLYRVRVDQGYLGSVTRRTAKGLSTEPELQGIAGTVLSDDVDGDDSLRFAIQTRLGSMCNTWVEHWSSDHDAEDGILSGYIVGKPIGQIGDQLMIWPMLFRSAADRATVDSRGSGAKHGYWLRARAKRFRSYNPKRYRVSKDGEWGPFRVDAEALGNQLEETNRKIREGSKAIKEEGL